MRTTTSLLLLLLAYSVQASAGFCDDTRVAWAAKDRSDVLQAAVLAGTAGMIVGWLGRGKRKAD
jgi:hypothetical protein